MSQQQQQTLRDAAAPHDQETTQPGPSAEGGAMTTAAATNGTEAAIERGSKPLWRDQLAASCVAEQVAGV